MDGEVKPVRKAEGKTQTAVTHMYTRCKSDSCGEAKFSSWGDLFIGLLEGEDNVCN